MQPFEVVAVADAHGESMSPVPRPMSRMAATSLLIISLLAVGSAGFWAGRVALAPPDDPLTDAPEPVTYQVVEQTIGQALQFAAVAEWQIEPMVRAWGAGVVTSVDFASGDVVDVGDTLFTVDLKPVVVARGAVPAFRDLQVGDSGPDVMQLEALLADLDLLAAEPDPTFDEATAAAVASWKDTLGAADDRVVRRGDVLFTPELPVRVVATDALEVGAGLSEGVVVVNRLSTAPSIVVPLTPEQRNLVPLSGSVELIYPEGTWEAVIARAAESSDQGVDRLDLVLTAPDGGPVCGNDCAEWVPPSGRTSFEARIVVIPETTGPVVPGAAIITDPGGGQVVRLADGSEVPIEVVASTGGLAVVSGVEVGAVVQLPFTEPPGG